MVAIELMRRGWEVYVGVLYHKEVDFVASMRDRRVYIQVSDDISQEATLERELDPLRRVRDAYTKRIITRTGYETTDWDGIKVIDLARWLMGESDELTFWRAMAWVEIIERGFCPAGRLIGLSSRDFLLARQASSILEKLHINTDKNVKSCILT